MFAKIQFTREKFLLFNRNFWKNWAAFMSKNNTAKRVCKRKTIIKVPIGHNWNQFNSHNHKSWEYCQQHKTMFYDRVKRRRTREKFLETFQNTTNAVCHSRILFVFTSQLMSFIVPVFISLESFMIWCIISHQNRCDEKALKLKWIPFKIQSRPIEVFFFTAYPSI